MGAIMRRIGAGCVVARLDRGRVGVRPEHDDAGARVECRRPGQQHERSRGHQRRWPVRRVRFASDQSGPGDTNGSVDVFVHDRQTAVTERVSLTAAGDQAADDSNVSSISADGRFVAFLSAATNLVSGDTNGHQDIFVRDRQLGTTTRVNVFSGGGGQASSSSQDPMISANGRYVAFSSGAANLVQGDTNNASDVFRHDLVTRVTTRVSVGALLSNGFSTQANGSSFVSGISADGQTVAFTSTATNLVSGDSNAITDAFVRDIGTSTTTRVSVGPGGTQGNRDSYATSISHDGRFVAVYSVASNLVPNGAPGAYVHDRQIGVTSALSIDIDPVRAAIFPQISGDGRSVCVLQLNAAGTLHEALAIDRLTLNKTRVSVASNGDPGNAGNAFCAPNADGTVVVFESLASNLVTGDTNGEVDVFVRTLFATVALEKAALNFGAVTSGATFVSQTATQTVRVTKSGVGAVTWTVASNQPWLQVSPASGSGTGALSIGVVPTAGLPPSGTVTGSVFVSLTGSLNALPPIVVTLTLTPASTNLGPFGTVDTPTDNRTGVTGAVPFTGWALDDIGVARVSICRAAFGAEVAPLDPNCGGAAEMFVGFAVFIDGARPDVAAAFPTYPLSTRAGWGFMVLTNTLPNQGNGTYQFRMRAQDHEGNWLVLGTRTLACANASGTLPFGTLDTPLQGGTASGTSYINFGWALTPLPKTIPIDGSTIRVMVDGVDVGPADYNHARPDIQGLFPGLNNTNGAIGFRILDTTLMDNGLHTISWGVTDNAGAVEGLGSRFFAVTNGASAVTAASTSARSQADIDAAPLDTTPLAGRRGWDLEAPYGTFGTGANGITVIRSEEVNRVELQLGDGDITGHLRTPAGLTPLPIGSRLDRTTNTFTWAPGVGFVGPYNFVFVRSDNGRVVSRRNVRIILHPKGRGSVGPQVVIDVPRAKTTVGSPFLIGGWAVDLGAAEGTGVTTLHAWAYPAAGGAPIFLGATAYGGARPDVAAVHGDRFRDSGFGLIAHDLAAGDYDLALFAWSTEMMNFAPPTRVRVSVTP